MSRVVGRRTLLAEVTDLLRRGRPLALHGPTGIGKSAPLDAVEAGFPASVLRATGAAVEQTMPYAALQDLLDHVPDETLARLPDDAGSNQSLGPSILHDEVITRLEFRRANDYPLALGPRLPVD